MSDYGYTAPVDHYAPTLVELLRGHAATRPDARAVGDARATLTWAGLWDAACRCAGGLAGAGVSAGDVVVMMLDNSAECAVAVTGINFVGAISVPTNTAYRGALLEHVITQSAATVAVVESHLLDRVLQAAGSGLRTVVVRGPVDELGLRGGVEVLALADILVAEPIEPAVTQPWDPFCIAYTSGTTGPSKGAWISTACAIQNQAGSQHVLALHSRDDIFYVVCPLFHASGLFGGMLSAWLVGAFAYIADRFHASTFWTESDAIGATNVYLIGTMAEFLMRQPADPADASHSIQKIMMLPLHPQAEELAARFAVRTTTGYGNTETGCFILCGDPDGLSRRAVGRVRPGFEVRLVDEHDQPVPVGAVGEVTVRSDLPWLLSSGYVGSTEAATEAWRNGWFHTGDALSQDADGYFYFFDRFKDAIRRRGENISSFELEREVLAHPDVIEVAAVGVASGDMEQEVKIAVVRTPGSELTEEELLRFLIPRLAYYMVPRYVLFVDELPKTPTAKIRKAAIRETGIEGCWDRQAAGLTVSRHG